MSRDPNYCPHGVRWHLACLNCRIDAERAERLAERKRLANATLNEHRAGIADYSPRRINAALELTGDICGRLA